MVAAVRNQDELHQNLRKQLAVAVRSIQWTYAIFWSLSTTQQGALEWGSGYYNGDIKTRKTVSAMELSANRTGLKRSEQLRELYESLLQGETEQQQQQPWSSAALSPDDLTDAEWYYLVCMSFVFAPNQGLPGRVLANGEAIWLCDASYADTKVFFRSLLAKSASIQTVVCFRHLDGVIELGVTDLVPEDPGLLQHIKASLLDFSKPDCSEKSSFPNAEDDDSHPMFMNIDHDIVDKLPLENLNPHKEDIKLDCERVHDLNENLTEDLDMDSADECSNCAHGHQTGDLFTPEGISDKGEASWHLIDDDISNGIIPDSVNSSDCISEAFIHQAKPLSSPRKENASHVHLNGLQEGNHTKLSSLDLGADDDCSHYTKTLSNILGSSNRLKGSLYIIDGEYKSSFAGWKKGETADGHQPSPQVKQKILKKILFTVPLMYGGCTQKSHKEICRKYGLTTMESEDVRKGHALCENENFMVLRSMVPSISEIDKASILNNALKYMKKLEARVEELESCTGSIDSEAKPRRNYIQMVEQISDNYDNRKVDNGKKTLKNKRKASDIDGADPEMNTVSIDGSIPFDVKLSMKEEVVIEMRCQYREFILLDILDAINNLYLDTHSVQSSNVDGILTLSIKSKFRGAAVAPAGMIKQALWKIAGR